MIPSFPHFKPLELSDKATIDKITTHFLPYSDFNFTSLFTWNTDGKTRISLLNNNLVIEMKDYTSDGVVYSFLGAENIEATIEQLLRMSKEKSNGVLTLIPEKVVEKKLKAWSLYTVIEDHNQHDYIYEIQKLIRLEGSTYHKKRNMANRFDREHTSLTQIINLYDPSIQKKIIALFMIWQEKKRPDPAEAEDELTATQRAFQVPGLITIGLYVDEVLIGFSITEKVSHNYSIVHFEKVNYDFAGASEYLMQQMARIHTEHASEFLNYEQDLGIEGLKKAKQSWTPHHYLKKYTIQYK